MKTNNLAGKSRGTAGVMLVECLVYIAVFMVLTGVAMASFYMCWDYSKALRNSTDDVESALRAGENWRADVRAAAGKIAVTQSGEGESVRLMQKGGEVVYRFSAGEVFRELPAQNYSRRVLAHVKASAMQADDRNGVTAWRWELELAQHQSRMRLPLFFTFEAVPAKS